VFDANGRVWSTIRLPRIEAPVDLLPRTKTVALPAPDGNFTVVIDPESALKEITRANNSAARMINKPFSN
jgi:hypothetical protein